MSSIIDRKFYSQDDELLCTLKYLEFSIGQIEFNVNLKITKQLEPFQRIFIDKTLKVLGKDNDKIEVEYEHHGDTEFIRSIKVKNLNSIEDFNLITSNVLKLLSSLTEMVITSKIERKFYSKEDSLLCIVNFLDFNRVLINFVNPDKLKITPESERNMDTFISDTLEGLKKQNPNIDISYDYYEETEIIDSIEVSNVESIKTYNCITEKVMDLLSAQESDKIFSP